MDPSISVPRVSIIIVNWNGLALLKRCLPSVVQTEYPDFEIVLADNASSDESVEWVRSNFPDIKIVQHPENWAFCRGNNAAVPHTTGRYIVLLNNDVSVPPDWLVPLVNRMEAEPDCGAVQPKLLQQDRTDLFEYAGGSGGFLDRFGYPFTRGRIFFTLEEDRGQYDDPVDIFWATGAAILLRRSALDQVGLLDEHFVLHMEEIDLCWRLMRQGYRIRVDPSSRVYHIGGASLPQGSPEKSYYNFRNSLLLVYKNLPPWPARRVLTARTVLDLIALMRALIQLNLGEVKAIIRAFRDFLTMRKLFLDDRPRPGERPVLPFYRRSIVWDYFIRRRRYFHQLPRHRFLPPPPVRSQPAPRERPSGS